MRTIGAAILASSLVISSAFAATNAPAKNTQAPLPPGKPAGVKKAQAADNTLMLVLGLGVVAGGIALVASGTGNGSTTTTTTATSP
jgi:hypothetical protein